MLQYLRSTNNDSIISPQENLQSGSWVRCERPSDEEVSQLLTLGLDEDLISDALDPHEVPRIEFDDEWTYLIARLPVTRLKIKSTSIWLSVANTALPQHQLST